jgi:iron-sulfur cluster repair protein YtfE (RIC family)
MKITDALLGEHAVLYELFNYLRDTALESDDVREVRTAVSVLERLLLAHARIEEELLFPRLEPHLGQMGPLAVMRSEHRDIDGLLDAARQESDLGALKSLISRLIVLAHGHFQKEEQVLFAMTRQFLDDATLTVLGDQWAESRKVTVDGQGCVGVG